MTRTTEAFETAVAPHYAGLVRRLTAVVRDPEAGQDLAQDAYMRAFRAWHRFDGTDARAWLHTIGLRLAFNERDRRRRWERLVASSPRPEPWVAPLDRGIHDALGLLRPEQRAALLLNAVDGYTQAEIAAMLDVPPGTVASWLARAKAELREALRDD
ncbi:MAG: RNA polymerase sigma factor [Chloroflexota bacterium]|nr:RNA polymerase sigma factor [Chloroflexota bacterium]